MIAAWLAMAPAQAMAPRDYPWVMDVATCAMPAYPKEAQRHEHTGQTDFEFLVRTDGSIAATMVKTSSGHAELDDAAQDALSQCRFKLRTATVPTEPLWQRVIYVWKLEDRDDPPPQRHIDNGSCARARYPAAARNRTMTGTVHVSLLVRPDGSVSASKIAGGSGHPALDSATRTALAACRFEGGAAAAPAADEWITVDYVWSADDLPPRPTSRVKKK